MLIESLLTPQRTLHHCAGSSKKRVLEQVARHICSDLPQHREEMLFDALIAREKLGSTGLGEGIAIPHCRMQECQSSKGALFSLANGIDFDALDGNKVDLLFVLLVPAAATDEHLKILAGLAERFSDPAYCAGLRAATSSTQLFEAALQPPALSGIG